MKTITNKPLTQMICDKLYADIVDGIYPPDCIITEHELIEKYNVSKSPVREAMITLCEHQILQSIPRAGYRVVAFRLDQVRQISETRSAIELAMLEKSFLNITEADLQLLEEANQHCLIYNEDVDTPAMLWERNMNFHLLLASFAKNEYMQKLLHDAMRLNARASALYYHHKVQDKRNPGHQTLIDAIRHKEYEKARQFLLDDAKEIYVWEVNAQ